jgi:hypothetical protein
MATVWLADKHHRKVAIKVLRPELGSLLGPDRFARGIRIAAGLNHPHVLPPHDAGLVPASDVAHYFLEMRQNLRRARRVLDRYLQWRDSPTR